MKSLNGLINAQPNMTPVERVAAIDWEAIDWRYSNNQIARGLNVSDQTISVYRKKHNKPKSSIYLNNQPNKRP